MDDLEENGSAGSFRLHGATSSDNRDRGRFTVKGPETARFWSKVALRAAADCCWIWHGGLGHDGYGRFRRTISPGVHKWVQAHRFAYELLVGPIPEGLTLDHTCGQIRCVRPTHLEPVTNSENLRRRHARRRAQNGATP